MGVCSHCGYGNDAYFIDTNNTVDESAGVNPDHPLNQEGTNMHENGQEAQTEMPTGDPKIAYPGKLDNWNRLKSERDSIEHDPNLKAMYEIATELAGLSYHLDGIRFGVRASAATG